jgi:nitrate reductase assembly molybdenum cofactor insertion protein NarJ
MRQRAFELLAPLLGYPGEDYHAAVRQCAERSPAACRSAVEAFAAQALPLSLEQLQEAFTAAFDLNDKATLDLGWHLFGEKYERGLLLVRMRRELAAHAIPESSELPDHLTHALLLLARMEREAAAELAAVVVLPALSQIRAAVAGHEPALAFADLLRAVDQLVRAEFPEAAAVAAQPAARISEPPSHSAAGFASHDGPGQGCLPVLSPFAGALEAPPAGLRAVTGCGHSFPPEGTER